MPLDPMPSSLAQGLPCAIPSQAPLAPSTAATPSINLDALPPEILIRIATVLDDRTVIALGETCIPVHAALHADCIRPLQLEGRLRWTTTLTQLNAVMAELGACSRSGRQRLLETAWAQIGRLHPALRDRAQAILRACATPPSAVAQLHHRIGTLPALSEARPDILNPALDLLLAEIESTDTNTDGELLTHWLRAAGPAGTARQTPARWRASMEKLTQQGAMNVLGALVDASHGMDDLSQWYEIMRLALDSAVAHAREQGWTAPWQTELLCAVARALAGSNASGDGFRARSVTLWREVFELVPAMASGAGAAVLSALALSVTAIDRQEPAGSPRWLALIDAARTLASDSAVADVLESIIDHCGQRERQQQRDWRHAVISAAQLLGESEHARVMVHLLEYPPPHDVAWLPRKWDALFVDFAGTACEVQAFVLSALGRLVAATAGTHGPARATPHTAPQCVARWGAVFERCMMLADDSQRLPPLIGLLLAGPPTSYSREEAVLRAHRDTMLLRACGQLPASDRARLLMIMLAMPDRVTTPANWRLAVDTAVAVPAAHRFGAVAGLAHRLLAFDHHFTQPLPAAVASLSPSQGRPQGPQPPRPTGSDVIDVATWPENAREARRHLSVLLRLLTVPERARLLVALATASPSPPADGMLWLLDERRTLPRNGRHDVALVHEAAAWLTRRQANEGHAVLPTLWQDVLALPPDHRAPAILHIDDFAQRHGCEQRIGQSLAAELAALPQHDRPDAEISAAEASRPYKRRAGPHKRWPH